MPPLHEGKEPTDQHYSKFRHLTGSTYVTRFVPLIISMDEKGEVVAYADRVHDACADVKGHSGMF